MLGLEDGDWRKKVLLRKLNHVPNKSSSFYLNFLRLVKHEKERIRPSKHMFSISGNPLYDTNFQI